LGNLVALPPNCLNFDNLFLDNWTPERLEAHIDRPVFKSEYGFAEVLAKLKEIE